MNIERINTADPQEKILGFFKEFPWLNSLIDWRGIQIVKVGRIDSDILNTTVTATWGESEDYYPTGLTRQIFLIDESGKTIKQIGIGRPIKITPNWFFRLFGIKPREIANYKAEMVWDALLELGEREKNIHFIVECRKEQGYQALILYKKPKRVEHITEHFVKIAQNEIHQIVGEI